MHRGPGPPRVALTHPLVRVRPARAGELRAGSPGSRGAPEGTRSWGAVRTGAGGGGRPGKAENLPSSATPFPERAWRRESRDLPATGPATLSRPFLSTSERSGWRGWGGRSRSRSPGPGPLSPALLPASHTCSGPGKAAAPRASPQTVRCRQLPARGRAPLGNRSLAPVGYDVTRALHRTRANQRVSRKLKSP